MQLFQDQRDADGEALRFLEGLASSAMGPAVIRWETHQGGAGRTGTLWVCGALAATTVVVRDEMNYTVLTCHDVQARPKSRDVGRIEDMSRTGSLRIVLDTDNDVCVTVCDESSMADVEFCVPGTGGGKSPRTRDALIALMRAMEADNSEDGSRDWWARRNTSGQPVKPA